ncbi:MAG: alpha-N-acetylglucosaminidase [Niameybacter sp.]|uniref:alpha-N-acetylglucosaminidase n=1 Tax=Niameybacter sp. TaxID=2033640 RepID=UPI002FC59934
MKEIKSLISRVLDVDTASKFAIHLEDRKTAHDYFELSTIENQIQVKASNVLAAASGVHWYMKHYLNMNITWCGSQKQTKEPWPVIDGTVYKETPYTYKYYLNYCTYGYSMVFWDWERWEQELDWMALNGINLVLSLVGHEEVWRQTLLELGYTNEEAKAFICGPAFMPWQWMQNIEGWGSEHTDHWFSERVALAKKIHERMKELGITPAMQGYSGMIPKNFKTKYQGSHTLDQGLWCDLDRPDLLIPGTAIFEQVAEIFYRKQKEIFEVESHFYCTDPFHEGGNRAGLDIKDCIQSIQQTMLAHDKQAIWVLQSWGENPDDVTLSALDKSHSLILDLWCESAPTWKARKGFNGIPWLWCVLGNFGGKNGIYGNLQATANAHLEACGHPESGQMLGIGMTMEGIENNPVVWDLLCDSSWDKEEVRLDEWLEAYIIRRYGQPTEAATQAWQLLKESIYNCTRRQEGGMESIFCARPRLDIDSVSTWGPKNYYYPIQDVVLASELLFKGYDILKGSEGYLYDMVDVTRQALSDLGRIQYAKWVEAFKMRDLEGFKRESNKFLEMIFKMDELLSAHPDFLLGTYLANARSLGQTEAEQDYLEWNGRTIITLWANEAGSKSLRDYAHRQWGGLTQDFYSRRWKKYFEVLQEALMTNMLEVEIDWYAMEEEWTNSHNVYPIKPRGDLKGIIESIQQNYFY